MSDDGFLPMGKRLHVRIVGDLVHIRNFGQLTLEDLHTVMGIYQRVHDEYGTLFVMYDVAHSMGVDRDARKAVTTMQSEGPRPNATAIYGASFAIRTVANMIDRALAGLRKRTTGMMFFDTEEAAIAYIEQERAKLKSKI